MPSLSPTIVKDITVASQFPDNNWEAFSGPQIDIFANSGTGFLRRGIFDFGSIAAILPGSTITQALLTLTCNAVATSYAGATLVCRPTTRFTWTENGATWNNDGTTAWTTAGGDRDTSNGNTTGLTGPTGTGTFVYDIYPTIQRILIANPTTCNFFLEAENEAGNGQATFDGDSQASPGTLVISYNLPGGDGHRYAGYYKRLRGREVR